MDEFLTYLLYHLLSIFILALPVYLVVKLVNRS